MKRIGTQGITYIEPLDGSCGEWYWGSDYASGDLYEAEELFRDGHPVSQNKLIFVHYPDGRTVQPIAAKQGQYFGRPIFYQGKITILLVDLPAGKIRILQHDDALNQTSLVAEVPRSAVKDCYNLMLETFPLMLARHGMENSFQLIWPERLISHWGTGGFSVPGRRKAVLLLLAGGAGISGGDPRAKHIHGGDHGADSRDPDVYA